MSLIQESIGKETTDRLKERYGILVDRLFVEEESVRVFQMKFQVSTRKRLSFNPTTIEREGLIGEGVAEIECTLYDVLNFGEEKIEQVIHLNHNLPKNGIHMHPAIYAELMGSERESMERIEGVLKTRRNKK